MSWLLRHGRLLHTQHVLHSCDNPKCVRPEHLFLGSHADNMADKAKKGRTARKIDEEVARLIRESPLLQRECAAVFGITQGQVSKIRSRARWQHLS